MAAVVPESGQDSILSYDTYHDPGIISKDDLPSPRIQLWSRALRWRVHASEILSYCNLFLRGLDLPRAAASGVEKSFGRACPARGVSKLRISLNNHCNMMRGWAAHPVTERDRSLS
jgi:hypothetical protein